VPVGDDGGEAAGFAEHAFSPDHVGQKGQAQGPEDDEAQDHGGDPRGHLPRWSSHASPRRSQPKGPEEGWTAVVFIGSVLRLMDVNVFTFAMMGQAAESMQEGM
jgi:hypothetical protein